MTIFILLDPNSGLC